MADGILIKDDIEALDSTPQLIGYHGSKRIYRYITQFGSISANTVVAIDTTLYGHNFTLLSIDGMAKQTGASYAPLNHYFDINYTSVCYASDYHIMYKSTVDVDYGYLIVTFEE